MQSTGGPSWKYEHRRASAVSRYIRNIRICMGWTYRFCNLRKWKNSIKNSLRYKKCVLRLSCVKPVPITPIDGNENDETKREFAFFQSLWRLFLPTYFVNCRRTLLKLNFKGLYPSSEREIKFRRCLFTSSIKREIRHFYVVVVQKRERNVQKSVMHVQSCCFA